MTAIAENPLLLDGQHLTVTRQGRTILNDVSLAVAEHDFITLIGPNGAGKSLLLKALLGLAAVDQGTIWRKPGLKLGFVPETLALDMTLPLTAGRFLSLGIRHQSIRQEILIETETENLLDRPLHGLSSGERQRVLLARALHGDPDLLVLDEPAQNLDMRGQLNLYELMQKIYEQRKIAILMVSHDLHLVMSSTRKVVCLYEHICCSGEPQTVAQDPEFVSLFGAEMARLLAVYPHHHDHDHDHADAPDMHAAPHDPHGAQQ